MNDKCKLFESLNSAINGSDVSSVEDLGDFEAFDDFEYGDSRYEGSYAHDVVGLSDEFIDAVFDGNPDAYWNID